MKKSLSLLLAVLLFTALALPALAAAAGAPADFTPVIRFIASSDTHIKENDDTNTKRIPKMLELGYSVADADPAYKALDAVLIVGDLTNDGTKTEFDIFWDTLSSSLREGTQFLGVVAKNHDGYVMKRGELRSYYTETTGNDPDFNVVINGYHFMGLSASPLDGVHYSASQMSWLREQLDAAVKEDPDKPVFFMNHEPALNTVYGSSAFDIWGIPQFKSLMSRYPQIVHFAGHSHYPLNDPRSVWQGNWTEIGTGAIYYAEFTIDAARAYDPADCREAANCWIVELDKDNNMRLRGYDVNEAKLLCERYLLNPADKNNREFTPAKQKAASKAPEFAEDAELTVTPDTGKCTVTAPKAQSTDGEPIVLYRAYAKNSMGALVSKTWTLPKYYRAIEENEIELTLGGLSEGEYTVSVIAENAYGMQSEPIETTVEIPAESGIRAVLARIMYVFECIKKFFVQLFA